MATELSSWFEADINTAYASIMGTTKNVALTFGSANYVKPAIEMLDIIAGGEGKFKKDRFVMVVDAQLFTSEIWC